MANKKGEIIDTTIRHIAERGDSFSTAQIASEIGCSQSLIFRYYRSKDHLMSECFDRICHELKVIFKSVNVPDVLVRESVIEYMVNV